MNHLFKFSSAVLLFSFCVLPSHPSQAAEKDWQKLYKQLRKDKQTLVDTLRQLKVRKKGKLLKFSNLGYSETEGEVLKLFRTHLVQLRSELARLKGKGYEYVPPMAEFLDDTVKFLIDSVFRKKIVDWSELWARAIALSRFEYGLRARFLEPWEVKRFIESPVIRGVASGLLHLTGFDGPKDYSFPKDWARGTYRMEGHVFKLDDPRIRGAQKAVEILGNKKLKLRLAVVFLPHLKNKKQK